MTDEGSYSAGWDDGYARGRAEAQAEFTARLGAVGGLFATEIAALRGRNRALREALRGMCDRGMFALGDDDHQEKENER